MSLCPVKVLKGLAITARDLFVLVILVELRDEFFVKIILIPLFVVFLVLEIGGVCRAVKKKRKE